MMTSKARALQVMVLSACTAMAVTRCLNEEQLKLRTDRFQRRHKQRALTHLQLSHAQGARTCEQVVESTQRHPQHLNNRALSPWTYRVNQDERRFPRDVMEARCLCQGCLLQRPDETQPYEEHGYNSVPVYAHVLVLIKAHCSREPLKYRLQKRMLRVPVACTCAAPEYIIDQSIHGPGPGLNMADL